MYYYKANSCTHQALCAPFRIPVFASVRHPVVWQQFRTTSRRYSCDRSTVAMSVAAAALGPPEAALAPTTPGLGQPLPHMAAAGCIYLDYNATTPVFPEVSAAMLPFLTTSFGNPSSTHAYGVPMKVALERARAQVAGMVGAAPDEIIFTSCGTESDNWAILGTVLAARQRHAARPAAPAPWVPHVVTTAIEHPAVLEALAAWSAHGVLRFTAVPVDGQGCVSADDVAAALTPDTVLVSVMHSNNEVGSLQPVAEIARRVHAAAPGVLVHTDAAQSLGKVAVDMRGLGADLCTIVGHKFGAPKGVAALYVRKGVELERLLAGGGQERGRRAGTENVLLAVGLGAAAALVSRELQATAAHMAALRDRLQAALLAGLPEGAVRVNGPPDAAHRLPNTLSISVRGLAAAALLHELGDQLAASAGAACHSGGTAVSGVLAAMGMAPEWAAGTLRLSVGRHSTAEEVDVAAELILAHVRQQLQLNS